jgi:Zn-dependent protease
MTIFLSILFAMLLGIPAMLLHECGHLSVALLCGVKVKKVGLSWTGLYTVREPGPRWANLCISLAGPLVNLVLAIFLRDVQPFFAWVNLIACVYNLLPIPNSDGSRVLALLGNGKTVAAAQQARPARLGQSPVA